MSTKLPSLREFGSVLDGSSKLVYCVEGHAKILSYELQILLTDFRDRSWQTEFTLSSLIDSQTDVELSSEAMHQCVSEALQGDDLQFTPAPDGPTLQCSTSLEGTNIVLRLPPAGTLTLLPETQSAEIRAAIGLALQEQLKVAQAPASDQGGGSRSAGGKRHAERSEDTQPPSRPQSTPDHAKKKQKRGDAAANEATEPEPPSAGKARTVAGRSTRGRGARGRATRIGQH
ncbi:hypothetical protein WJX73_008621 [Symbiochloris irregularis]|uniref:Uncharacterized protein n=1 Tax=Symbiochloris irregularis TaxID=706552 RepID=A0AAW1NXC5_9CHLO